jgi:diamine N-acetyltransferase
MALENCKVTVRLADGADNRLLAEMGRRTFYDSFASDNSPQDMTLYLDSAFSPYEQAEELADPGTIFFISEIEGLPVGYARMKIGAAPPEVRGERTIEIARFYVEKEWIGRGVGSVLMAACVDYARKLGCDSIWLDVWGKNERAIAFYKKWGFSIVGSQHFLLGHDLQDDFLMQREVGSSREFTS